MLNNLILGEKDLVLIVGLGLSGQSVAAYLAKRQIPFKVADSRATPETVAKLKEEFEPTGLLKGVHSGEFTQTVFCDPAVKLLILSPGVPLAHPVIQQAKAQGKKIVGDIELFAHEVKKYCPHHQIIGITGSNGKSTVTALVGELLVAQDLKVVVAGNIGVPVLSALDKLIDEEKQLSNTRVYFVLELSSFQLETTESLDLTVATILNISPNHLDRYNGSVEAYAEAKHRIYANTQKIIANRDHQTTFPIEPHLDLHTFGLDKPLANDFGLIHENGQDFLAHGPEKLLPVSSLTLMGQHNYANALTSLAILNALGISLTEAVFKALSRFSGLAHRCEKVAEINQVHFVNDSKGTSTGATVASINGLGPTLKGKIVLIAGGDGKGAEFSDIIPVLKKYVRAVVLIGRDADKIAEIVPSFIPSYMAEVLDKAVPLAFELAQLGDTVLLSPLCASWDQYPSYVARGEHFKTCVHALSNGYTQ